MRTILISNLLLAASLGLAADYTVHIDADLQLMRVEARFDQAPSRLSAQSNEAADFILDARTCDGVPLRARGNRLRLNGAELKCLQYRVDLAAAARSDRRNQDLDETNMIVSPALWLWRPAIHHDGGINVQFDAAVPVSVPWIRTDAKSNRYRVPDSPSSAYAPAAFGNFDFQELKIPGATMRVTLMKTTREQDRKELLEWLRATAMNINLTYGRFPNPAPNIVILPSGSRGWSDAPVPFGRVIRDGGETIELFVDPNAPIESFYDDWTATHEFSHLMLPFLQSDYHWISEGFAQYYQNLLLARAGQYTETRAWQKLYDGLERGLASRPELSPIEAARIGVPGATMKIYWSGAALALMADVELRRRGSSLDAVLDNLQTCCLPSERRWTGPELFQTLDDFVAEPLFMPLYHRYAHTRGFPDTSALLRQLGVNVRDGIVYLDNDVELSDIRKSMTHIRIVGTLH